MLYCQTTPNSKTLGQFENLVFVIMSTRENIRLIARSSLKLSSAANYRNFVTSFLFFEKKIKYYISRVSSASRRFLCNIILYLLFWEKQQNLKLSSAANYRNFVTSFLFSYFLIFQENRLPADIIPYFFFF